MKIFVKITACFFMQWFLIAAINTIKIYILVAYGNCDSFGNLYKLEKQI